MISNIPGVPEHVQQALATLLTQLIDTAGDAFLGLVLYGGLARGRYREGMSDVNVVVVLADAGAHVLQKISPALLAARRAAGVTPMLMTPVEVPWAALDFPPKFLDIARHHIVLHGLNPFASLQVPVPQVLHRVAQSLRNTQLRLRQRYLNLCEESSQSHSALAHVARPLAIELSALLQAQGHVVPDVDRTVAIYALAAKVYGLDASALTDLAAVRQGVPHADALGLMGRVLSVITLLSEKVARMAEQVP
jgi:hypothetical protein